MFAQQCGRFLIRISCVVGKLGCKVPGYEPFQKLSKMPAFIMTSVLLTYARYERLLFPLSFDVPGWSWCILVFWAHHEPCGTVLPSNLISLEALVALLSMCEDFYISCNYTIYRHLNIRVQLIYVMFCVKRDNFSCTDKEVGVQKQLSVLATLLKVLDPKLHQHIGTAISSSAGSLDWG